MKPKFSNFQFPAEIVRRCLEGMKKYELILTDDDLILLKHLVELMGIFEIFTVHIQGQTYPTLNSIVLFRSEIKSK